MENNAIKVQMGQAIRRLREKERLSQERLGLMTGISRQYLIKIEHGVANPTVELLYRIACGLGTKMTRILDEADLDELSSFPEGR